MDSETASIMDLGYDIECALCATHSVSPGPLAKDIDSRFREICNATI